MSGRDLSISTWDELIEKLRERFLPPEGEMRVVGQWRKLQQTGSMARYADYVFRLKALCDMGEAAEFKTRIFWPVARTTSRSAQVPPSEPPPTARARKIVRCGAVRRSRNFGLLRKTEQRGSGWEHVRKARCEERGFGISKHSHAGCWEW